MNQEQFDTLVADNQPHPVLNRDFMRYYPDSFVTAFLPKAHAIVGKGCRVYDGAGLFSHATGRDRGMLSLTEGGKPVHITAFTYPTGVEAAEKTDRMMASEDDLLILMEYRLDGSIGTRFRFGHEFADFLSAQEASPTAIVGREYTLTPDLLRERMDGDMKPMHDSMMRFALRTMGLDPDVVGPIAWLVEQVQWLRADGSPIGQRTPTDAEKKLGVNLLLSDVRYGEEVSLRLRGKRLDGMTLKVALTRMGVPLVDAHPYELKAKGGEVRTPSFRLHFDWYDESAEEYVYGKHLTHVPDLGLVRLDAEVTIEGRTRTLGADNQLIPFTYRRNYEELVGLFYRPKRNDWTNEKVRKRGEKDAVQNYENGLMSDPDIPSGNKDIRKLADEFVAYLQHGQGLTSDNILKRVESDATKLWQLAVAQAQQGGNLDDRPLYWARNKMETWLKRHPAYKYKDDSKKDHFDLMTSIVKPGTELEDVIRKFEELSRNYKGVSFEDAKGDEEAQERITDAEGTLATARALPLDDPEREQKITEAEKELEKAKKVFKVLVTGFDPFQLNEFDDYGNILQSNPSGCVALSLQGKSLGQGFIQTMIVPVRYSDFDSSPRSDSGQGEGIIEKYVGEWADKVDMIITVSQAGEGEYNIDAFATRTRGGLADNQNYVREKDSKINPAGNKTILTTLPESMHAALPVIYWDGYTEKEGESRKYVETDGYPKGDVFEGPGSNYLSNEIFYRVAALRNLNNASLNEEQTELRSGHFHISKIQGFGQDFSASDMNISVDLIRDVVKIGIESLK